MYFVYRFLDKKNNIIYVGKSKQDLEKRFRSHTHLPDTCYNLTYKIEYIKCSTESDMSIKEIYYINKYRHDGVFFNVLDMTAVPTSVDFNDKWKQYKGPLGQHFPNSINYCKGYSSQKETRYNKDGSIDQRKPNSVPGMSTYVDALTPEEVDLIVDYFIDQINCATNNNQEQFRFRNLVIFILGINIPHKLNDYMTLKYGDVFDQDNDVKKIELKFNRFHKDEILYIPLNPTVKKTLQAYAQYLGWTYVENADDPLFKTRQSQIVSTRTWWRIIKDAAIAVGIDKNIGVESQRKTYGLNIYSRSEDKLNSLLFLSEIWGQVRESHVITYLNLTDQRIDFDYYLGERFSLGNVDLSKIRCLNPIISKDTSGRSEQNSRKKQVLFNDFSNINLEVINISEKVTEKASEKLSQESSKNARNNSPKKAANAITTKARTKRAKRRWTEEELEIIQKYLSENIPIEVLAERYKIHKSIIRFWINTYVSTEGRIADGKQNK